MPRNLFNGRPLLLGSLCAAVLFLAGAPAWCAAEEPGAPAAAGNAPPAGGDEFPAGDRQGIEQALQEKVSGLMKEKNAQGLPYKRGSYSKHFRRVDEATCQVGFHVDTADAGSMKTERFLLTLKKEPSRGPKWTIVSEELKHTFSDNVRPTIDGITFHRFDSIAFSREGLKVTGTKGSLYKSFLRGELAGFSLSAPDLAYEYEPPVAKFKSLWKTMKVRYADDVIFKPGYVRVSCDPVTCEELLSKNIMGLAPATVEALDPPLRDRYDKVVSQWKSAMKNSMFWGFSPPRDPDNRAWRLELAKSYFKPGSVGTEDDPRIVAGDPGPAIALSCDNYQPMEVSFDVYGLYEEYPYWQTVYAYYSEDTRKGMMDPAALERRADYEARDFDLESLKGTIEMGVEESELMTADVTFGIRTKKPVSHLPFDIARLDPFRPDRTELQNPKMFVNSVEDGEGRELTYVKLGPFRGLVIFPEEIPAGTLLKIRARFQNNDAIYKINPSFSYVSRGGWLPFVRFGDMIHDFDLEVKVPARYTVLGIGRKILDEVRGDLRVTRWVPDSPVNFPTVIYGDYITFASKVQAKKRDGTPIPVVVNMDRTAAGVSFWQVWYDVASETVQYKEITIPLKSMQAFADEAANALNLYAAISGVDYPFSKLDLVNDPQGGFYGQAPSSIVYLGQAGFMSKGTLGTLEGMGGSDLPKFAKSLVAHETAHQWWGSLIGNANYRNYWWVESLAEYFAALFVENVYGKKDYAEHVKDWRLQILDTDMTVGVQDATTMWGGEDFSAYQTALYNKGPYVFHVMRSIWGDEKFFKFIQATAQALQRKEVVTRDIQKIAEEAFGGTMEWFFDQWIRQPGIPEFKFTHTVRPTEDGKYVVEGQVEQRLLFGRKKDVLEGQYVRTVVPITMKGRDGKEFQYKLLVDGPKTPFKFKVADEPKEVVFNKYGEVLAYDVISG